MNPSASGWIKKALSLLENEPFFNNTTDTAFYLRLRETGFVYGTNVATVFDVQSENTLTEREMAKVNLFTSLLFFYQSETKNKDTKRAIDHILSFYQCLKARNFSFLDKIIIGKHGVAQLEKVIDTRVRGNTNIFTKYFGNIVTNVLLFVDILAFIHYLRGDKNCEVYVKNTEIVLTNTILKALSSKEKKSDYDELLIRLVESSLRYHEITSFNIFKGKEDCFGNYTYLLEKYYFLDLATMAIWDDIQLDTNEHHFLHGLGNRLQLPSPYVSEAATYTHTFIEAHKESIAFFNSSNPVKNFYEQAGKTVSKLILRNRKRLTKELLESKELVVLLTKSTHKELSETEKRKVREQLLDVCKSIPSLAIFALPGGAVLLPIFVKFIPKLLPSAFDDNRVSKGPDT
ncbi:LETM1-related biofilm-associated protein [Leptobacterium sp. I13]|uniref:LETM1-related biofilm-associated protein n=1 Tax=Leptobacterium meishanense TaxID=3128904 RepID=UPI0030EC63C0